MDKVEDIVGRLRALIITPIDEDIEFIKEADDAMEKAADLIQSQQALIEEMREALEEGTALLEFMKEDWVDYDHIFSIHVHETKQILSKALSQKE